MYEDQGEGEARQGAFWTLLGPILLAVAGGAILIAVGMNTATNTAQDEAINALKDAKASAQERLGRIETDIDSIRRSQGESREDVKEIRKLLEGRGR